jgi:HEAT repeat protein
MERIIVIIFLIAAVLCSCNYAKGKTLDNHAIEKMLSNGDSELLLPEVVKTIEKKEYPFIGKYVKSTDPSVRNVAICFLEEIGQPWCYAWYLAALNDPIASHRAIAAEGILRLKTVGKSEDLIAEIEKEKRRFPKEEWATIPYLTKAIGNIGSMDDIYKLRKIIGNEGGKEIAQALLSACAKLGDEKAVRQIKESLMMGCSTEKMEALDIVNYLNNPSWIADVLPLLNDRSTALSFEIGPNKVTKRVCDFAVNTLILIDSEKRIPLEPMEAFPYNDQDILLVKGKYGINSGQ